MGNLFEAISAAVLDDDPRRREWVRRELARLGCEVKASAGHGIVGVQTLYEAAPAIAFVSFEEPYARTTTTITHASIASRVVAYTSDPDVGAYQAAIRAGAHVVLSSPPRPADLLKALERALPRKAPTAGTDAGQVVAVTSAKGGTGKSTIAANLAALLAREHASTVLLIDFAIEFGDSGLLLNLGDGISTARAARQIARSEIEEFRESLGYHSSGLFVLAALQRFSERVAVDVHELEALLQLSIQSFDHVVVDTAAVFDDRLMLALESADLALLSVTPDVVSLVNTRRFLRDLENEGVAGEHFLPVLNGASEQVSVATVEAAQVLERSALWEVPFDKRVAQANQQGVPSTGKRPSPAMRSLRALASRIANDPANIERRDSVRVSKARFDPVYAERLRRFFAPPQVAAEPGHEEAIIGFAVAASGNGWMRVVYSGAGAAAVFHREACAVASRIRPGNRVVVEIGVVPSRLRACKLCESRLAAAA